VPSLLAQQHEFDVRSNTMRTFLVDWYGPFDDTEIATHELRKLLEWPELAENGLYAIIGKKKNQKKCRLQYIGISKNTFAQRFVNHHAIEDVCREKSIWVGKLNLEDEALKSELELVEHALLHFSDDVPMNDKKKKSLPSRSCIVISRFWDKKGNLVPKADQCFEVVPSVIIWDYDEGILHYSYELESWTQEA
jgi:hypothetical protein